MTARKSTPGTRLALARNVRGWSQKELAKRMGVTPSNVSWMERELNDMKTSTAVKIAAVLGCSPGFLAFGREANTSERARELVGELQKGIRAGWPSNARAYLDKLTELAALLGAE